MKAPVRGEIWLADLDPIRGHEQGGKRPVLVISADIYNSGPAGLVVVLPLTKTHRGIPLHLQITPPEGGTKSPSSILCDAMRSISKDRLVNKWGVVSARILRDIEDKLRILWEL
jgi:mRNA interferase MazF